MIGNRLQRHLAARPRGPADRAAQVRALQRRSQLGRVESAIAQRVAWARTGRALSGDARELDELTRVREGLLADMRAAGQTP